MITVCSLELQLSLYFGGEFLATAAFPTVDMGWDFVPYNDRDPISMTMWPEMA